MPRYWQDRVWLTLSDFRREVGLAKSRRPRDAPRSMILLAAYLGSPGTDTARVMDIPRQELIELMAGRVVPTLIEMERLHDWIACSLWRHLWRAGSPEHGTREAVEEALAHAGRLAEVPAEWARDWSYAAAEVEH